MKILKILAVLAAVSAVILAGCQNNFTGTTLDTSALTAANRAANAVTTAPTLTSGAVAIAKDQIISINLGDNFDSSTVNSAISIKQLSSATAPAAYSQGTAVTYTVQSVNGNTVNLLADCSAVTTQYIEVFIDSTKLTYRNGASKLNLDGDQLAGETGDDDVYLYPAVTGGSALTGTQRNPRAGFSVTSAWNVSTTAAGSFTLTYAAGVSAADPSDYKALFDSCVSIEKYDVSAKTWSAVSASATTTYAAGVYTFPLAAVSDGVTYRAKFSNLQSIVTKIAINGFIQRATMDPQITTVYGSTTVLDTKQIAAGTQTTAFAATSSYDGSGKNKAIILTYSIAKGSATGDQGITESTFTTSNVKVYNATDSVFVPISSIVFGAANTASSTKAITIYLDSAYATSKVKSYHVYLGTAVATLGDAAPITTAAGHFGDSSVINDQPYGAGFRDVVNTSF